MSVLEAFAAAHPLLYYGGIALGLGLLALTLILLCTATPSRRELDRIWNRDRARRRR